MPSVVPDGRSEATLTQRVFGGLLVAYMGVCGAGTFFYVWWAAIGYSGWVVGIALGWIPAAIAGYLALLLSPLAGIATLIFVLLQFR